MHKGFIVVLLVCLCSMAFGQRKSYKEFKNKSNVKGEIYGKVLDANTSKPMEYTTVSLISLQDNKLITGAITDGNGGYDIIDVPMGMYTVKISFLGYAEQVITPVKLTPKKTVLQIKDVLLQSNVVLDEVVIDGTSPTISYEIDKKIIDVSKLSSDLAQSAVEILENIPSINVDVDGTVSLRGSSSFTLLIDGKPTALDASEALNTIPASTIKNIEIITNPSAKYDAEGVSGIINVVLKQNKLRGASMLANLSGGSFEMYGGDIAANYRTKKHGFDISGNYNHRPRFSDVTSNRTRITNDRVSFISSVGERERLMQRSKIKGQYTYEPNTSHSLIIGGGYSQFYMDSYNEIWYNTYLDDVLVSKYLSDEDATRHFGSVSANLTYRYNIQREKNHYLEFNAIYSEWNGDELILSDYIDSTGYQYGGTKRTETGPSGVLRFNLDYYKKMGKAKFETGVQMQIGRSGDNSKSYTYDDISQTYEYEEIFSKEVTYDRDISAVYAMYGSMLGALGYQVGLRVEHTLRDINADETQFDVIKRFDFFPSFHLSYHLPNENEILLNYTRRIHRPRSYHFEPFITWNSTYSVSSGNPELLPEYIDAFELNWNKSLSRRGNIGMELYYRNTKNQIQRIETVYQDDILLRSPINIGKSVSAGLQVSASYKMKKWWKSDLSFNFYQYKITGNLLDNDYNQESFNWNGRWNNSFPIRDNWQFQFVLNYSSPSTSVQGTTEGHIMVNTSIKKSFLEKKFALTLQGRNILSTMKRESNFNTGDIVVYSKSIPKSPIIVLTASLRLNNYRSSNREDSVDDI